MAPELVIFDCDGVLVDSEPLAARVLCEALLALGLEMSVEQVDQLFRGRSLPDIAAQVEELLRVQGLLHGKVPDTFLPQLRAETERAFDTGLAPIPGVHEALSELAARGVDLCVASSGSPEKIRHSLRLTELSSFFEDRVFSAAQVERGKPAPDLFLFAAQQMGHPIASSVVIEDSLPGVTGALAAGATVFGFVSPSLSNPAMQERELEKRGARVFRSMTDLPGLLSRFPEF